MTEHTEREPSIAERKQELRRIMRAGRAGIPPEERLAASRAIAARLDELPELAAAQRILAYAAMPTEVDLDVWLRVRLDAGIAVLLPRLVGDDLQLGKVEDLDVDLEPGWQGLREPRHVSDHGSTVDAAVMPGLAFDRQGWRLGQGGGHFDRLLAALDPAVPVIGVAFDLQLVEEGMIPVAPHDVPVDVIVTQTQVQRCGRFRRLQAL